jgi:hypothetical protein
MQTLGLTRIAALGQLPDDRLGPDVGARGST